VGFWTELCFIMGGLLLAFLIAMTGFAYRHFERHPEDSWHDVYVDAKRFTRIYLMFFFDDTISRGPDWAGKEYRARLSTWRDGKELRRRATREGNEPLLSEIRKLR
jgi:hypothetical protein